MHDGVQTQLCCESDAEAPILVPQLHSCGCSEPVTIIKVAMVIVLFPLGAMVSVLRVTMALPYMDMNSGSVDIEQQL